MQQPPGAPKRGWILYDGACRFCIRWAHFWKPVLERNGFKIDELQAGWVAQAIRVPLDDLLHDIRLLKRTGELVSGADVYLQVTRCIWWLSPFYWIFSLPGLNAALHLGYRWFARNRYCVSGACRRP